MKERYTYPEMSIVFLELRDVITSSEIELPPDVIGSPEIELPPDGDGF